MLLLAHRPRGHQRGQSRLHIVLTLLFRVHKGHASIEQVADIKALGRLLSWWLLISPTK